GAAPRRTRRPRRIARLPPSLPRSASVAAGGPGGAAAGIGDERCSRGARHGGARARAAGGARARTRPPASLASPGRGRRALGTPRAPSTRGVLDGADELTAAGDPLRPDRTRRADAVLGLAEGSLRASHRASRTSGGLRAQPSVRRLRAFRRRSTAPAVARR